MKFRKKPVVIDAFQVTDFSMVETAVLPRWFVDAIIDGTVDGDTNRIAIKTLEGEMEVSLNDWIIRGTQGELYPCKADIFAEVYEPADTSNRLLDRRGSR